jgi:hypothetical protein
MYMRNYFFDALIRSPKPLYNINTGAVAGVESELEQKNEPGEALHV